MIGKIIVNCKSGIEFNTERL